MTQQYTVLVTMGGLGDAVLFSPAMAAAVRRSGEERRTVLLAASELVRAVYAPTPGLESVTVVDTNRRYSPETWWRLFRFGRRLRRVAPVGDLVFASRMAPRLCRLIFLAVRPKRVHMSPGPSACSTDLEVNVDLARRLAPDAAATDVFVPVPEQARQEAEAALNRSVGRSGRRFLALYPSVARPNRPRWPLANLARAAARILEAEHLDCAVVLGSTGEGREWRGEVGEGAPFVSLAGELSISGTAAVLQRAALAVCNDGGVMHLAGAVGCPLVGIMPNVSRHHRPPGQAVRVLQPRKLACHPCHPRRPDRCRGPAECVRAISEDAVVAAAHDLLPQSASPDSR
ncbi:MAG: glycosyltransferase family 9 protein [Kiritimatiellaeota bacterium]|nr:glycosyltransferase family 9 protein [Kiritimatiellota bacterium]